MKSREYYIECGSAYQQVKGYKITLPGYEQFCFFAHRYGKYWQISEAITGKRASDSGMDTMREAIENIRVKLEDIGREKVISTINDAIKLKQENEPVETYFKMAKYGNLI